MPRKNRTRTRKGNLRKKYSRKYRGGGFMKNFSLRGVLGRGSEWLSSLRGKVKDKEKRKKGEREERRGEERRGEERIEGAGEDLQRQEGKEGLFAEEAAVPAATTLPTSPSPPDAERSPLAAAAAKPTIGGKKSRRRRQRSKRGRKSRRYRGGSGCLTC